MNTSIRTLLAPLASVALAVGASGCGDGDDDDGAGDGGGVTVTAAWVREPAEGQANSAGYGTITNTSGSEITLVGASAPVTATIEIHETIVGDDGVMSMREKQEGFVIADGATLTLEPGGPHIMMLGVDAAEFTDPMDLTFVFNGADPVTVPAELRELPAGETDMDMDDGEMEMDDGEDQERLPDPMDGDDMAPAEE